MVLETVAGLFQRTAGIVEDDPDVVYECRRCGRSVEVDDETEAGPCPECGGEDLARYELD